MLLSPQRSTILPYYYTNFLHIVILKQFPKALIHDVSENFCNIQDFINTLKNTEGKRKNNFIDSTTVLVQRSTFITI